MYRMEHTICIGLEGIHLLHITAGLHMEHLYPAGPDQNMHENVVFLPRFMLEYI